jgi:hypothetical protein
MKHLQGFYDQTNELNEAKITTKEIKSNFTNDTLIQVVDADDKNIGQAKIKKGLKTSYNVSYKLKNYKVNKDDLSLNTHGQIQTELKNLK